MEKKIKEEWRKSNRKNNKKQRVNKEGNKYNKRWYRKRKINKENFEEKSGQILNMKHQKSEGMKDWLTEWLGRDVCKSSLQKEEILRKSYLIKL